MDQKHVSQDNLAHSYALVKMIMAQAFAEIIMRRNVVIINYAQLFLIPGVDHQGCARGNSRATMWLPSRGQIQVESPVVTSA